MSIEIIVDFVSALDDLLRVEAPRHLPSYPLHQDACGRSFFWMLGPPGGRGVALPLLWCGVVMACLGKSHENMP